MRFVIALALCLASAEARAAVSAQWAETWRSDLAFAADTLPRVHPNLFHTVSREQFRSELDSLGARLASLDHHEIVVELARIMARVGDGHTRLTLPFDSAAGFFTGHSKTPPPHVPGLVFRRYPLKLGVFEDGVFVIGATAAHRELLGGRIVELGRRPIDQAIAAVEPTIQRDNAQQVRDLLPVWLVAPEILHARGVVPDRERARVVVEIGGKRRREAWVAPAPPGQAIEWLDARGGVEPPLAERHPQRRHWIERLERPPIVYARYREVLDDGERTVEAFAREVLGAVGESGGLILDLRGNVGGNNFLNRPLLHAIIGSERLREPGALFAMLDRGTFSAATMLLADLEAHTGAVLAGETSGGSPNGYGDSRRVRLPGTGLTLRVSTLYWQTTDPRDRRDGFAPLIAVARRFADWKAGRDPALDTLRTLATGGGSPVGAWRGTAALGSQRIEFSLAIDGAVSPKILVNVPALELKGAAAADARISGDRVEFTLRTADGPWRFSARSAGASLVGNIGYKGSLVPFVAGRGAK